MHPDAPGCILDRYKSRGRCTRALRRLLASNCARPAAALLDLPDVLLKNSLQQVDGLVVSTLRAKSTVRVEDS